MLCKTFLSPFHDFIAFNAALSVSFFDSSPFPVIKNYFDAVSKKLIHTRTHIHKGHTLLTFKFALNSVRGKQKTLVYVIILSISFGSFLIEFKHQSCVPCGKQNLFPKGIFSEVLLIFLRLVYTKSSFLDSVFDDRERRLDWHRA